MIVLSFPLFCFLFFFLSVLRGGGLCRIFSESGLGKVRGVQCEDGSTVVSYRSVLLRDAGVFLPVLRVHERAHGEPLFCFVFLLLQLYQVFLKGVC